jgi:hypothetical protein
LSQQITSLLWGGKRGRAGRVAPVRRGTNPVKWDIFANRKRGKAGRRKDDIDVAIGIIERFAPRKYQKEREIYYYNYRMMPLYPKPLLSLLQTLAQRERMNDDETAFARQLFLNLKAFYDPKDRLPLMEAKEDSGLKKKFSELFLFFYGNRDLAAHALEGWLKSI